MPNEIDKKAAQVSELRKKFNQTWASLSPRLSVKGIIDEAVGQLLTKKSNKSLATAIAVTSVAFLFNSLQVKVKAYKYFKSKTSTSKQEIENYENANSIRGQREGEGSSRQKGRGTKSEIEGPIQR